MAFILSYTMTILLEDLPPNLPKLFGFTARSLPDPADLLPISLLAPRPRDMLLARFGAVADADGKSANEGPQV